MRIIPRSEWGARPPRNRSRVFTNVMKPTVHYNGPATRLTKDSSQEQEAAFMRIVQDGHFRKGWADFAYNFAVFPSGRIYEGRGWKVRSAANGTNRGNFGSYAIFIAVGQGQPINTDVLNSVIYLRQQMRKDDVQGHRDHKATQCPGAQIYGRIQRGEFKGSGWASTVYDISSLDPATLPLVRGSRGLGVKALQRYLGLTDDGEFGPLTEAAVRGAQLAAGLEQTGRWEQGEQQIIVRTKVRSFKKAKSRWLPLVLRVSADSNNPTRRALTKRWQRAIGDGYVDGRFDRRLEAFTKGFQAAMGLTKDGIVGRETWGTMFVGSSK